MTRPTRGFLGRRREIDPRLPPGQYDVGSDFHDASGRVQPDQIVRNRHRAESKSDLRIMMMPPIRKEQRRESHHQQQRAERNNHQRVRNRMLHRHC